MPKRISKTQHVRKTRIPKYKQKKGTRKQRGGILSEKWNSSKVAVDLLMKDNLDNNTSGMEKYLSRVCPKAEQCLTFGPNSAVVKEYFDNFVTFKYLLPQPIGITVLSSGANGSVKKLVYKRGNYETSALLKMGLQTNSDNTLFEAFLGYNYINVQNMYFPCFVETYGAFKGEHTVKIPSSATEEYVKLSCVQPKTNSNLIQHITRAMTLTTMVKFSESMKNDKNINFFRLQIIKTLYQVYAPLNALKNEFTHYDLHTDNVILYRVPNSKFIEMRYYKNSKDIEVSFLTSVVAKIIDYGRCYTPLNRQYYDMVCAVKSCAGTCGSKVGYVWLNDEPSANNYYISSLRPNISHDLRLAYLVGKGLGQQYNMFNGLLNYTHQYGVTETASDPTHPKIDNISDMTDSLLGFIREYTQQPSNNVSAILHIYLDRSKPMRYEAL